MHALISKSHHALPCCYICVVVCCCYVLLCVVGLLGKGLIVFVVDFTY
jgi:hypothetical protein